MSQPEHIPSAAPRGRLGGPNRRTFLAMAGAVAMTATGGRVAAATGTPGSATVSGLVPETLAYPITASGTVSTPFAIDLVGLRWTANQPDVRIRFADQAGDFGEWQEVSTQCDAGFGDAGGSDCRAVLVPAGRSRAYQVELSSGASAVALNCTDGPPRRIPAPAHERTSLAGCVYLSRAAWGADESLRFDQDGAERFPQTYWPVQTVTVHHTGTGNDDPDPAARVRAIYRFQTVDEDFGDIGYHFLIDEAGRIYEGRWSGEDGIPGFNPAGLMVNAAHVGGFNAGNVGIALLGTFTDRAPTLAARRSLTFLLAVICAWRRIDPLATVRYVNPISGATRTVAAIPGHRDWAATLCPGEVLAGELAAIRQDVAALVARLSPGRTTAFADPLA